MLAAAVVHSVSVFQRKIKKNNFKLNIMDYPFSHPIEGLTIKELSELIRKGKGYEYFSDEEFSDMIKTRKPLELILMAFATFSSLDSA